MSRPVTIADLTRSVVSPVTAAVIRNSMDFERARRLVVNAPAGIQAIVDRELSELDLTAQQWPPRVNVPEHVSNPPVTSPAVGDQWISTTAAAQMLGVHVRTVRNYVGDGRLIGRMKDRRALLVDRESVEALTISLQSKAA